MGECYLEGGRNEACFGCEACAQVCPKSAIRMIADPDGFRYPEIDKTLCINCGLCKKVCANTARPTLHEPVLAFGGYVLNEGIRSESSSGGLFSALANSWADDETIIFGAEAVGLDVRHSWIKGLGELQRFRKSKYLQSRIVTAFVEAKQFLLEGKRVLFSGTPCQIAGLKKFLQGTDQDRLLTIEVICEGVPSPNYIQKFAGWLEKKLGGKVIGLDYRYKDGRKWDFQVMEASLQDPMRGIFTWKKDRWFNPFWSIWLQHLISRPSCYECPFARRERCADVSLGDLWGVHLYCPELYGRNGGASIVFCNTTKGVAVLEKAKLLLFGHELRVDDAIRYQGPLRSHIKDNPRKVECLKDVRELSYEAIIKKWAKRPTLKLLVEKYIWGNRQKVWLWNLLGKKGSNK